MCNSKPCHRVKNLSHVSLNLRQKRIRLYNTVRAALWHFPISKNSQIPQHGTTLVSYKIIWSSGQCFADQKGLHAFIIAKSWWDNDLSFNLTVVALAALAVYLVLHRQLVYFKQKYNFLQRQLKALTIETNETIERLRQSEIVLLENNKIKNQLITMVLHDIRSPVRSISTISSYLADKRCFIPVNNFNETLHQLKLGSRSLETFTEKFFLWADSQRDDFKIKPCYFALDAFLLEVTNLYQDIAKMNENKIMVLPTCLVCFCDYQLLACVIRNLVDNANKYTFHGIITLSAFLESNELILNVSDTGNGLTPAEINDFITGNVNGTTSGTGSFLILALLKKIEGRLQIQSAPGKGSTFSIRLKIYYPAQTG
ncbi:sensor histidine kinase [Dyadobacter subterraneus]|uniref:histidine kinase n=1 Tax=Dyadobacter subterraneus TaxID=2773304 RepID=A0ABR9W540_9BACT|nr:HAMP domain-containing sensor histidine kinase [Dyadobacter subterraneus]MBE9460577.1 HAMP domain-containing histidine kinase [Dyadobacter subterraneus]